MDLNLVAKLATAAGLTTWPWNSPVFVFPHLTSGEHRHTETGDAGHHWRAQRASAQAREAGTEAAGGRPSVPWGQSFRLGRTSPGNTGGDGDTAP